VIEEGLRLFLLISSLTRISLEEIVDKNYILKGVIVMSKTRTMIRDRRNYIDFDTFKFKR